MTFVRIQVAHSRWGSVCKVRGIAFSKKRANIPEPADWSVVRGRLFPFGLRKSSQENKDYFSLSHIPRTCYLGMLAWGVRGTRKECCEILVRWEGADVQS